MCIGNTFVSLFDSYHSDCIAGALFAQGLTLELLYEFHTFMMFLVCFVVSVVNDVCEVSVIVHPPFFIMMLRIVIPVVGNVYRERCWSLGKWWA